MNFKKEHWDLIEKKDKRVIKNIQKQYFLIYSFIPASIYYLLGMILLLVFGLSAKDIIGIDVYIIYLNAVLKLGINLFVLLIIFFGVLLLVDVFILLNKETKIKKYLREKGYLVKFEKYERDKLLNEKSIWRFPK